ncbi:retrovirus-related pol polyprotein from transposon TNT 1-94 [Tanacetum coccineum]
MIQSLSAFRQHTCFIRNLEVVDLLTGSRGDNLYTLSLKNMMAFCLLSKASKTKSWLWHRCLSHLNFGAINHLARHRLVRGLPKLKFDHLCSACALGKSLKKPHKPKSEDTNQEKLYLLHMDLCGPMLWSRRSMESKYILLLSKILSMIQVRLKEIVRRIRTDNGTEFVNQTLRENYKKVRISHETPVARSPQQNGVIEKRNRTLIKAARTMLIYAKAPLFLWDEAVATAELHEFERLEVWELVPPPDKAFVITLKWIYKVKLDELGEVYVSQPDGFVDPDKPTYVYKLKKALYGLKQAPRAWYDMLSSFLISNDLSKGLVDPTLFIRREGKELLLVQIYVDDIIFVVSTPELCDLYAKIIPRGIFINQSKYALESLKKYGFESYDPVDTPIVEKSKLDEDKEERSGHLNRQKSASDIQYGSGIYCFDPVVVLKSKHIDIRFHFIKEHVENGVIELYFVNTEYQLADIFTKALGRERIEFLINKLGMRSFSSGDFEKVGRMTLTD